jgi:hypothetical protein
VVELTFEYRSPTDEEIADYAASEPDDSTILFQLIYSHTGSFPAQKLDIYEVQSEGKGAFWENESCTLNMGIEACVESDVIEGKVTEGWWVIEKFVPHYSKDYYGEVDCDYECDNIRRARWSDVNHFGLPLPLLARLLLKVGVNNYVPFNFEPKYNIKPVQEGET